MSADLSPFDAAVVDPSRNVLVVAPPGCGKTELLARRAELLIPALGPHQRILALTFSNKAKSNLNSRLVKVLGAARKRRYVTVRNFHGHAAEIIRSHGATLGVPTGFEIPTERTLPDAIAPHIEGLSESAARDLSARVADELRAAKQAARSDEQVLHHLGSADPISLQVEMDRQASGVLFFEDLLRHAQRLLRVPGVACLYRCHYGAVLVDEFQDLSIQQLDIAVRTCDTSRTFVGDPLQGIYSWTGARPIQVERILRRIGGEPLGLGVSYRSSPRVLEVLGSVASRLGGQPLASFEPDAWFEGGIAVRESFRTGAAEARFVHDTAMAILAKRPDATIGVICRSGWRRRPIDGAFESAGTPCTRWDVALDDPHVTDIVSSAVTALGPTVHVDTLRDFLLWTVDHTEPETLGAVLEAVDELDELAAAHGGSIAAALAALRVQEESPEAITPGVHLLNAHKGKGQQFDWVFIPGFEQGNIPSFLAKGEAQLAEEHRVLLVMISRARHGVVITRADSLISKRGNPYPTKTSEWYGDFDGVRLDDATTLAGHIDRLPQIPPCADGNGVRGP